MWVLLCSGGHRESTGGCPPPTWAEELHGTPLPSQSGPQAWYPTPLMGVGWGAQTQSRDRQRAAPEPTPATMGTSGSVGLFMKLGKQCFPIDPHINVIYELGPTVQDSAAPGLLQPSRDTLCRVRPCWALSWLHRAL